MSECPFSCDAAQMFNSFVRYRFTIDVPVLRQFEKSDVSSQIRSCEVMCSLVIVHLHWRQFYYKEDWPLLCKQCRSWSDFAPRDYLTWLGLHSKNMVHSMLSVTVAVYYVYTFTQKTTDVFVDDVFFIHTLNYCTIERNEMVKQCRPIDVFIIYYECFNQNEWTAKKHY